MNRKSWRFTRCDTRWVGLVLALVLVLPAGCRRQEPPGTPASFEIDTTTPAAAAQSTLRGLVAQVKANAAGDRATANATRDRIIAELVARPEAYARYRSRSGPAALEEAKFFPRLVTNWGAIIAYYADELRYEDAAGVPVPGDANTAVIVIPARGDDDEAYIALTLKRNVGGAWRTLALEFLPDDKAHALLRSEK